MTTLLQEDIKLSGFERLEGVSKAPCPECKSNRMYYCYDCHLTMPGVFTPQVDLPCAVDVVKHPMEKNSKSSAIACSIVAPKYTRIFDIPEVHDYRQDSEEDRNQTCVVFPSSSAISIQEFVKQRGGIKRMIVLDCTWFQTGVMQKVPQIQGLQHVALRDYRTIFWRPQHNVADCGLATIEAIYFALREYEETQKEYDGGFDDLLFWFFHTRHFVEEKKLKYIKEHSSE